MCKTGHEPTWQRIKPEPVSGKIRQIGSVPVNPGNRAKIKAWSCALGSDLEVCRATSGGKPSPQPQLLTCYPTFLSPGSSGLHPFLIPSFSGSILFFTSFLHNQAMFYRPHWSLTSFLLCLCMQLPSLRPRGYLNAQIVGTGPQLLLHRCCCPQELGALCSPAFPKPPHSLAKWDLSGLWFRKHASTNYNKFLLMFHVPSAHFY